MSVTAQFLISFSYDQALCLFPLIYILYSLIKKKKIKELRSERSVSWRHVHALNKFLVPLSFYDGHEHDCAQRLRSDKLTLLHSLDSATVTAFSG
jgi:hypothetical protein